MQETAELNVKLEQEKKKKKGYIPLKVSLPQHVASIITIYQKEQSQENGSRGMEAGPTTSFHCAIYNYWLGRVKRKRNEIRKKKNKETGRGFAEKIYAH